MIWSSRPNLHRVHSDNIQRGSDAVLAKPAEVWMKISSGRSFVCLLLLTSSSFAADQYEVVIQRAVETKMRDGVILRADIYRPKAEGKFPVLLQRTPYNKEGDDFGFRGAAHGYVVIIQDVRGRYSSEGEWYPFLNESNDGYDTVEWAAQLPYSNGKVGMFGGSYVGATQMLAAIAHPPHLAGICPEVTASNYHENWTYQGGAFEQWFNESWTSGLAQDTLNRKVQHSTNALSGIWKLPLSEYPLFVPGVSHADSSAFLAPYFLDWLAHPNYDDYWKRWSIEEHFPDIQVPSLTIAAWYDIFLGGSLRNYMGMRDRAGNEAARRGQRLLVLIGGHAGSGRKIGDVDFGEAASLDVEDVILPWYDYLFKNVQNEFSTSKPIKIFVMGSNEWRSEDTWPLARAVNSKYFLHSGGKANSLHGDGTISIAPSRAETADQYVYDPTHPVPTIGGPLCCDEKHLPPGPRDQRPAEARYDVLVYSTPPLANKLEVTGPITLELYASSSAVDTDFTGKVVDVWPNGFAQNVAEGIIRARYRDSLDQPKLINPGQIYQFKIDLWATSSVFRKGHILRLELSSSNFPRFDRNLNTGLEANRAQEISSATNTIYHDDKHPSTLILPIVPAR